MDPQGNSERGIFHFFNPGCKTQEYSTKSFFSTSNLFLDESDILLLYSFLSQQCADLPCILKKVWQGQ